MGFVKVIKNKAYFKRFQVKYRRRREGKTDYKQRSKLICQDKNKYNSPKYRLVVRITNKDIICQIVEAKIVGDVVHAVAYAHELPRYGMSLGVNNYAGAYATGLLCARRILHKLGLADKYQGQAEVTGEHFVVEPLDEGPRPFYALLDVGLRRTTTGCKVFAALKGACDGGIEVPHSERRFVGYDAEEKKLNPETLRKYIFAGHVADYMRSLKEEDNEKYQKHFSRYVKQNINPDDIEGLWSKVHANIRKDPSFKKSTKERPKEQKRFSKRPMSLAQRKDRVRQKLAARNRSAIVEAEE